MIMPTCKFVGECGRRTENKDGICTWHQRLCNYCGEKIDGHDLESLRVCALKRRLK